MHRGRITVVAAVAVTVASACGPDEPPGPGVHSSREVSILPQSDAIEGRDGGQSVRAWDRSIWVFGDTVLTVPDEDGRSWHHNSISMTSDLDASDGIEGFVEPLDAADAPAYLLAPTPDEQDFNDAHYGDDCAQTPCGARWAVWPTTPVLDPTRDRVLLFYALIYAEPGDFGFEGRGVSVATWDAVDAVPQRPELVPGTEHPTILFPQGAPTIGTAAVLEDDTLYTLACDQDGFDHVCRLARVPVAEVLSREAWRMWDGEGWTADLDDGAVLFVGAPIASLSRNAALDAWMVVYTPPFDREIVARTAPALTGPWSAPSVLYRVPEDEDPPYDALHHAEFEEDDGLVQYVTYSRHTTGWFGAELPVVRVELTPP